MPWGWGRKHDNGMALPANVHPLRAASMRVACCLRAAPSWLPMRLARELALLLAVPAALGRVTNLSPVTVSATRDPEPLSQLPFTVEVIPQEAFTDGASLAVDDALQSTA